MLKENESTTHPMRVKLLVTYRLCSSSSSSGILILHARAGGGALPQMLGIMLLGGSGKSSRRVMNADQLACVADAVGRVVCRAYADEGRRIAADGMHTPNEAFLFTTILEASSKCLDVLDLVPELLCA